MTEEPTYRKLTPEEYSDLSSRILYEDNHLLIVNKRAGEIVQGDKTGDETLGEKCQAMIAERDGKPGRVFMGVPHRLDRPVSGITVFAKTSKALERMAGMFRDGNVHKTYWALTCGEPPVPEATLENWLARNEKLNKSYIVKDSSRSGAKLARLRYRLIGRTKTYFLLEVELLTGRHHQIRCQLAGIGCHIKGDLKYGARRSNPDGGICLHSRSISFIHPVRKEEISVTAPVPDSWKGLSSQAYSPDSAGTTPLESTR